MTSTTSDGSAAKSEMTAETRKIVLAEIRAKWGKFSEHDLSALKSNDDLVDQVVGKYSLEKVQAQTRRGCLAERPSYLTLTAANNRSEAASCGDSAEFMGRQRR